MFKRLLILILFILLLNLNGCQFQNDELSNNENFQYAEVDLGVEILDMQLDPQNNIIWILTYRQSLIAIDQTSLTVDKTIVNGSLHPSSFIMVGESLWIVNDPISEAGFLANIELEKGEIIAQVEVGNGSKDVVFDGTNLWVSNFSDRSISVVDPTNKNLVVTIEVGRGPTELLFDGNNVWVINSNDNSITVINAKTFEPLRVVDTGNGPSDLAFDGKYIWISHLRDNRIFKIDNQSFELVKQINLTNCDDNVNGICEIYSLSYDGINIWASSPTNNAILKISPSADRIVDIIPTPYTSPLIIRTQQNSSQRTLFIGYGSPRNSPITILSRISVP